MIHKDEVNRGERFEFGANWELFLRSVNDDRISMAEDSLKQSLNTTSLQGKTFLDIGSGSGLFSLAARRLGAHVLSFDFDPKSVACTRTLRERYFPNDGHWLIEEGSALDSEYVSRLGKFDIVYSWGVLHHTGQMWPALANAAMPVSLNGLLFISIYNDIGVKSRRWLFVKKLYNHVPRGLKWIVWMPALVKLWGPQFVRDLLKGKPFHSWVNYSKREARGMTAFRDLIDWVGGLPFEVATPEGIFYFFQQRGFVLSRMKTCGGGIGCNEFVFKRSDV